MSTHVYVLQRLKALGDGQNGVTILHWTYGKCAERLLLRSAATDYTHIYTVYSIQTGKCWGKNQRRRLFECKVIKGHSILYRQTHGD